jgi:hypothetical protein
MVTYLYFHTRRVVHLATCCMFATLMELFTPGSLPGYIIFVIENPWHHFGCPTDLHRVVFALFYMECLFLRFSAEMMLSLL